jgi:hypothetical protein
LSFHAGGFVNVPISDKFSIQPELLYSAQGENGKSIDVTLQNDYINLPVMDKFYVSNNFTIEAGPQIGLLLSAKIKYAGHLLILNNFIIQPIFHCVLD